MAHPRMQKLLDKVRTLSAKADGQKDEEYQAITEFTMQKVVDDVANYTHVPIEELPEALDTTIVALALNAIAELGLLNAVSDDDAAVASLSEGDTSVSFVSPLAAYQALSGANTITTDYQAKLNTFRVVKR